MNSLWIATQYLRFYWLRSALLVLALTITIAVPLLLNVFANASRAQLQARAEATPLLLGRKTSALDVVISSLYFFQDAPASLSMQEVEALEEMALGEAIPLHTGYEAGGIPVVGTGLAYFEYRALTISQGRRLAILGEAVLGSKAARKLGLAPGDTIVSTPENLFDIGGQYPLQLNIVGVFAPTGTPDDEVIFTDIRTSWVIAGLGHGHEEVLEDDTEVVLETQAGNIVANAALQNFIAITPENLSSFHFHGDSADFPVSSALVLPTDDKSRTLLLGRYQDAETVQLLRPQLVIAELLDSIFRIKRLLDAVVIVVSVATGLVVILVMLLSVRLRSKELETMHKIGSSRSMAARLLLAELAILFAMSLALAAVVLALLWRYQSVLVTQVMG